MISSRPRRWLIKGIKSQILFNTNSLVFGKHLDKVIHFQTDSDLMRFKNNCPALEPPTPERGDQCFSEGIQWPIRAAELWKSFEEKVRQLLKEKDQWGKQKKAKALQLMSKSWLCWPRRKLLWRTLRRSVSVWKKSSAWNWLKEESFKEISEKGEARKELADLWHHWEAKAQQWICREEELQDMLQDKKKQQKKQSVGRRRPRTRRKFQSKSFRSWTHECHRLV